MKKQSVPFFTQLYFYNKYVKEFLTQNIMRRKNRRNVVKDKRAITKG